MGVGATESATIGELKVAFAFSNAERYLWKCAHGPTAACAE